MNDRDLVKGLIKLHSLKVSKEPEFKLASGEMSRFYCDVKKTALSGRVHLPLAGLLFDAMFKEFGPVQTVAGVALGGCHLASIVGLYAQMKHGLSMDVVYVRKEAKDHGTKNLIERPGMAPWPRTVLLEDVVTTGESSLRAAEMLREAKLEVSGILAVVDRRKNRVEHLGNLFPFAALYPWEEIIEDDQ